MLPPVEPKGLLDVAAALPPNTEVPPPNGLLAALFEPPPNMDGEVAEEAPPPNILPPPAATGLPNGAVFAEAAAAKSPVAGGEAAVAVAAVGLPNTV